MWIAYFFYHACPVALYLYLNKHKCSSVTLSCFTLIMEIFLLHTVALWVLCHRHTYVYLSLISKPKLIRFGAGSPGGRLKYSIPMVLLWGSPDCLGRRVCLHVCKVRRAVRTCQFTIRGRHSEHEGCLGGHCNKNATNNNNKSSTNKNIQVS